MSNSSSLKIRCDPARVVDPESSISTLSLKIQEASGANDFEVALNLSGVLVLPFEFVQGLHQRHSHQLHSLHLIWEARLVTRSIGYPDPIPTRALTPTLTPTLISTLALTPTLYPGHITTNQYWHLNPYPIHNPSPPYSYLCHALSRNPSSSHPYPYPYLLLYPHPQPQRYPFPYSYPCPCPCPYPCPYPHPCTTTPT